MGKGGIDSFLPSSTPHCGSIPGGGFSGDEIQSRRLVASPQLNCFSSPFAPFLFCLIIGPSSINHQELPSPKNSSNCLQPNCAKLAMNWSSREKEAALRIQQFLRKALEQKKAEKRRDKAAAKIQALVRGFLARRHFKRCLQAAVVIQSHFRGFLVRRRYSGMFERG